MNLKGLLALAILVGFAFCRAAKGTRGTEDPDDTQRASGEDVEFSALWFIAGLAAAAGFTLIVALVTFPFLLEPLINDALAEAVSPGAADLRMYELVAQIIPVLYVALGFELGIQWSGDRAVRPQQAGIMLSVGAFAMFGLAASLVAVGRGAGSSALFWCSVTPVGWLALAVAMGPIYTRRPP
jgi:hypothetical protein